MEFNSLIYPAPDPSCNIFKYLKSQNQDMKDKLLLIEARKDQLKNHGFVPKNPAAYDEINTV